MVKHRDIFIYSSSPYLHFVRLRQHLDNDKQISSSLWQQLSVVADESSVLICMRCRGLEIVELVLLYSASVKLHRQGSLVYLFCCK